MTRLAIKCSALDKLIGGGLEPKIITEIYGEAGTGKTNICLQASRESAARGKKVAYIGEISPSILENWEFEMPVAAFELNLTELFLSL